MQEWLGKVTFKEAKQFVLDASSGFLGTVSVVESPPVPGPQSMECMKDGGWFEGSKLVHLRQQHPERIG